MPTPAYKIKAIKRIKEGNASTLYPKGQWNVRIAFDVKRSGQADTTAIDGITPASGGSLVAVDSLPPSDLDEFNGLVAKYNGAPIVDVSKCENDTFCSLQ